MPFILVVGTTFAPPLRGYAPFARAADMAGRTLARHGFGLITGCPPGVDSAVAGAFVAECRRHGRQPEDAYRQLWLPHFRRGYWMPGGGFRAPPACVQRLASTAQWTERVIDEAAAGILVGGRGPSMDIARRFIDAGKPVLPIPFVGGASRAVFEEILRTWGDAPVPGLSRAQFLRLAVPWINDAGLLATLLKGTLARTQDIFISYRRSGGAYAAGHLQADLRDHFGDRRVFFDLQGIRPSADWQATIDAAIDACKVGVVVIGPEFMAHEADGRLRLHDPDDVVRRELRRLLDGGKAILPVLVGGARPLSVRELPEDLAALAAIQARPLANDGWAATMHALVEAIEVHLQPVTP